MMRQPISVFFTVRQYSPGFFFTHSFTTGPGRFITPVLSLRHYIAYLFYIIDIIGSKTAQEQSINCLLDKLDLAMDVVLDGKYLYNIFPPVMMQHSLMVSCAVFIIVSVVAYGDIVNGNVTLKTTVKVAATKHGGDFLFPKKQRQHIVFMN